MAVGTAIAPITFTSSRSTPAPGDWSGIFFGGTGASASRIANVAISYAGIGLNTQFGAAQSIDHVSISNSSSLGLFVYGGSSPTLSNLSFAGNVAGGLQVDSVPTLVPATLCYWSSPSGPSGAGPGTGQSVSTGVLFEPWLRSAPTPVQYFTSLTYQNRTFNPNLGTVARLAGTTILTGTWSVKIFNSSSVLVRTFTGSGTSLASAWDGKDQGGVAQPPGTYSYQADATATTGEVAATAQGNLIIDTTKQLTLSAAATYPFFSPNSDGIQDTTTITGALDFDDAAWTLTLRNAASQVVRSASGTGQIGWTWDGTNGSGVIQPDGAYTAAITATDGSANASASVTVILDNTPPIALVTAPMPSAIVSNVYQNGSTDVVVAGTASDTNIQSWLLDYGTGASPTTWTVIVQGATSIGPGTLGTWATGTLVNGGLYTLRLAVTDKAGTRVVRTVPVTVQNFKISQDRLDINVAASAHVTYTSVVPFALTETVVLKSRRTDAVVRTLVNQSRPAGTYTDVWDGRAADGTRLRDDRYYYVATVVADIYTTTFDSSAVHYADYYLVGSYFSTTWDPFNNQPLTFSYNFDKPGDVGLVFTQKSPIDLYLSLSCDGTSFCRSFDEYQGSGPQQYQWAGVDDTGAYRPDASVILLISNRQGMSLNDVVVYGGKPRVSNVRVTPPLFGPAVGTQVVAFDLATFTGETASVTVTWANQASRSILRTMTASNISPGTGVHLPPFDGRADNGMLVAPGFYTVTVTAVSSRGERATGEIATTIEY